MPLHSSHGGTGRLPTQSPRQYPALYVELLAAIVSAVLGSQWGISTLYSGIAQGMPTVYDDK